MKNLTLEERITRLERALLNRTSAKNELFGLGKPTAKDEAAFANKLFTKYPSLKRVLSQSTPNSRQNSPFHLALYTKDNDYNGIWFLISTKGGRGDMYCTAFDKNDLSLAVFKPFNMDKDINKVALFMLEQLEKNAKMESCNRRRVRKNESIPLNTFDCEQFALMVQNNLKEFDDAFADVVDDNADYGFVNVGIECNGKEDDYDVIANEYNSYEVMNNDKKVGECKSLSDAAKMVADHFKKTHVNK